MLNDASEVNFADLNPLRIIEKQIMAMG